MSLVRFSNGASATLSEIKSTREFQFPDAAGEREQRHGQPVQVKKCSAALPHPLFTMPTIRLFVSFREAASQ